MVLVSIGLKLFDVENLLIYVPNKKWGALYSVLCFWSSQSCGVCVTIDLLYVYTTQRFTGAPAVHVLPFTAVEFKEMQRMGFSPLEDLYVWHRKALDAVFYVKRLMNFQGANFHLKFEDNGHFSKSNAVFSFTFTESVV